MIKIGWHPPTPYTTRWSNGQISKDIRPTKKGDPSDYNEVPDELWEHFRTISCIVQWAKDGRITVIGKGPKAETSVEKGESKESRLQKKVGENSPLDDLRRAAKESLRDAGEDEKEVVRRTRYANRTQLLALLDKSEEESRAHSSHKEEPSEKPAEEEGLPVDVEEDFDEEDLEEDES